MDEFPWVAEQLIGVSAEVVALSLNEVRWEGLQPLREGGEKREGGRGVH